MTRYCIKVIFRPMEELMDEYKLSESEIAALKLLYRSLKKKREAYRVKVVYSLGSGVDVDTLPLYLMLKPILLC
ncbi:MAG: hypothetical protein LBK06_04775 [Planctomycetaceae bacterium]|nr:hypothetical protein [Planctomycetaceae bacterium]